MAGSSLTVIVTILAAALCDSARGEGPEVKFANQIRAYNDEARSRRDILAGMLNTASEIPAFTKEDVKLITAYMEAVAAAWSNAAAALEKGDDRGAAAFVKEGQELDRKRDIWNQRLAWRRGQAQLEYLAASEKSFDWLVGERKADEVKEIEAFIEAKKLRSEAYGRLADAATPDADPLTLAKLQHEVFALDIEVQVADMKKDWANADRDVHIWIARDPSVSSPELTAAKESLEEWRKHYEEMYRQSREREYALQQQKREYKELFEARSEAYRAAKTARDQAAKTGK